MRTLLDKNNFPSLAGDTKVLLDEETSSIFCLLLADDCELLSSDSSGFVWVWIFYKKIVVIITVMWQKLVQQKL